MAVAGVSWYDCEYVTSLMRHLRDVKVSIEADYSRDSYAAPPKGCCVLLYALRPVWYLE